MFSKLPATLLVETLVLLTLVACAPESSSSLANSTAGGVSPAVYSPEQEQSLVQVKTSPRQPDQAPQGMLAFDGSLFVATTELLPEEWRLAGWRISDQPIDTEVQTAPPDCTLYPHLGVADQWVGSCTGHVMIPQAGAANIAVILTHPDGSTTMIQVAPQPSSP